MSLDLESADPTETVEVPSPYANDPLTIWGHLKLSAYWFATNFLWGAMLLIMLPGEAKHMAPHFRVPAIGILSGVSSVIALLAPLLAGAMSDRCMHPLGRRRPFIIVGVGINLVGLFLMDLVFKNSAPITSNTGSAFAVLLHDRGFLAFLLAYMVVQLGNNIASAAFSGIIPDMVPHEHRGAASGYMALMSQGGTLLGILCVVLALDKQTETVKYLMLSVVLALVAGITIVGVRETPLTIKPPPFHWGSYLKSLWIDPRKYPDFAWVWITRFLVMLGFYAVLPFINYYFTDVIGIENPEKPASYMFAVILLASSVSGVVGGYISDRIGRKQVVYVANAVIAVMSIGLIFCSTLPQVLILGLLFGLGYGAYISVDWALGTDVLPSKMDAAKEMGVWHIAMTFPQTIASPIAAALIAIPGMKAIATPDEVVFHYTHLGYAYVFIMAAVCFILGAFFLKNVRGVK